VLEAICARRKLFGGGQQVTGTHPAVATRAASPQPGVHLKIEGLSKSYGMVEVVKNFNLEVHKGEFISLLGPSGCGKTTTLRILAGFSPPSSGSLWLDGRRIDTVPTHKRDAAMVFQNYALFPHMTVEDNVGFGLKMQKVEKTEKARRVGEALELVRLGHLGKRYPKELSGGQQQRVALARAIVLKPELLLLDEPMSNLDAKLRKELRVELTEIHRLAGTTTILVTHDLDEAFSVSDRVAVMDRGMIQQFDTPMQIFNAPANASVAEFVGHSNRMLGPVVRDGADSCIASPNGVMVKVPGGAVPGEMVSVTIPAHLVSLSSSKQTVGNSVPAKVRNVSYVGAAVHYEVELGGWNINAEVPVKGGTEIFHVGDDVYCNWDEADFISFPTA
jgi:putative spermidine/putrescine transport system ATP-binding protein